MGGRVTANLRNLSQYKIAYVEASPERQKEMAAGGIETTPLEQALDTAEVVILAVPDRLIARITQDIVPKLKPGTIVVGLDPAAAYAENHAEARRHHLFRGPSLSSALVL